MHSEHLAAVLAAVLETIVEGLVKGFLVPPLASQCQTREEQVEDHKFRVASRLAVEEAVSSALTGSALQPKPMASPCNMVPDIHSTSS